MMLITREFLWSNLALVQRDVDKLSKRAAKLGVPFSALVSAAPTREVEELGGHDGLTLTGRVLRWGSVSFSSEPICYSGWRLLAVLTPMPSEDGSVALYPSLVPGEVLPAGVREWSSRCDHCHADRRRNETFVLAGAAGELKQVGSTCIRDYLGTDADAFLSRWGFIRDLAIAGDDDDDSWGGSRAPDTWRLSYVLAATSAVVRRMGWLSRGRADETGGEPTSSFVSVVISRSAFLNEEERRIQARCPVEEQDRVAAAECLASWLAGVGSSDYDQNAQLLARADVVIPRAFGLAVSLLPVWQKRIADAAERAEIEKGIVNEFAGVIGKRQEFEVLILGVRDFDSEYGARSLVTFKASTGHILKWWASNGAPSWVRQAERGQCFTVKATPKKHESYNGRKETTLARVAA